VLSATDKLRIGTTVFELRVAALPDADELQATAARQTPDFSAAPPQSGPPPSSMPPPSAGPAPPSPAYAPPPPPYASGGVLSPSPYAVPAGAQLSGWWRRVGATLLDALISLPFLIIFYVLIVSPILMARDGEHNGQTWGKQALGIRVSRDIGQPFTYGTALLRDFVVKSLLFGAVGIIAIVDSLWPLWDEQNQALHDKLLGTHVLKT
jgi:uncharacterized RDD family membrane protein YckC